MEQVMRNVMDTLPQATRLFMVDDHNLDIWLIVAWKKVDEGDDVDYLPVGVLATSSTSGAFTLTGAGDYFFDSEQAANYARITRSKRKKNEGEEQ